MDRLMDDTVGEGFTFGEVSSVRASAYKVVCCDLSPDGTLLASGGHDKKVVLRYTDTLKPKTTLEGHSSIITDVRFSPSTTRVATSSFDKTVGVWDVDNPAYSIRTFLGHSAVLMSLDFHPNKEDLICSCDRNDEIRYWSINNGSCVQVFKGGNGTAHVRFQPRLGRYLALATENVVSILDSETQTCHHLRSISFQFLEVFMISLCCVVNPHYTINIGHTKPVHYVCWDKSGELLASISEDSVRVWTLRFESEGECLHELKSNEKKFYSCVFHPSYSSLLIVGCCKSLELWNMSKNKSVTLSAHEGLISSLAVSTVEGLVASASHDKFVKFWK